MGFVDAPTSEVSGVSVKGLRCVDKQSIATGLARTSSLSLRETAAWMQPVDRVGNIRSRVGVRGKVAGFTLIETVIVVVLLGVIMAGMTVLFVKNVSESHQPYLRQRTLAVAAAFMDEILRKRWDDNTPLGGGCVNTGSGTCPAGPAAAGIGTEEGARSNYDDIDDYDTISNQNPPQDSAGNNMTGYDGFTVSVTVDQPGVWNGVAAQDVKRIRVQVTSTVGETMTLTAYRVNF